MLRSASHEAEHEGDHEQNKRYPKEDFRAFHRSARDAAETEEGRHDSDHQKNDGPVKQVTQIHRVPRSQWTSDNLRRAVDMTPDRLTGVQVQR